MSKRVVRRRKKRGEPPRKARELPGDYGPSVVHRWVDGETIGQTALFVARCGFVVCFRLCRGATIEFEKWAVAHALRQATSAERTAAHLWREARILGNKTEFDPTIKRVNLSSAGTMRRQAIELWYAADRILECVAVAERQTLETGR